LPVGPEMFDICGRSSLIFSRDIQGIWYGGWPYTYISLSLSRVSCHLHISPSACIHYPIGPAFTQQLSRHWWHRVKYEDQHGRDPPFGMANAQLLQLHQSQSAAQTDLYTHTNTQSPGERYFYPATQSTILPIACQLQIKHHQRAQLVWKETILGPDNLSFQLFIHDFASFSPLR
jgi:hypothetical protein